MALGTIPPWLNVGPTDYLQAIHSGTQAGLEVARMRATAQEAAARRALAQQEAQRNAWEFGERLRQQAQLAQMENERQREYQSGVLDWHREQMRMDAEKAAMGDREAQSRINETMRHNLATEALSQAELERSNMPTEWERDPTKSYVTRLGAAVLPKETTMDPVQKALLATETKRLQAIDKELFDITGGIPPEEPGKVAKFIGWGTKKKNQYDTLMEQRNSLLNSLQSFGKTPMGGLGETNAVPQMGTLKPLDRQTAIDLLKQAGGDKEKARELARQLGYTF